MANHIAALQHCSATPMVADQELYDRLGVPPDASPDEIKRAYKKLAVKCHPDKQTDAHNKEASETKFKEISEAYSVLGDPDKRKSYDTFGTRDTGGREAGGFDMGDIFSEIFAGGIGGGMGGMGAFAEQFFGARPHPSAPRPDMVDVDVSLEEVRRGSTKKITYDIMDKCESCDGIGAKEKTDVIVCIGCNGRGIIMKQIGPLMMSHMQCPSCGGKGETIKHNKACGMCNGAKRRMYKRSIDLKLPTGVPNEFTYTIAARGSYHIASKSNVDLVLRFIHKIPSGFQVDYHNLDVHTTIKLSISDVFCGFEKKLHIYSKTYTLRKLKYFNPREPSTVKNLGIPAFKTKCYGNLVVNYDVIYPTDATTIERFDKYRPAFLTIFKRDPIVPPSETKENDDSILNLD